MLRQPAHQHPHGPPRAATPQDTDEHTNLLRTRALPALVAIHFLIVLTPDARPRRPPDDVLLLLLPRPLLLLLAFFPSNLNTSKVLAVLVPKNIPRSI